MSFQKMMDNLKAHIDTRFDALETLVAQPKKAETPEAAPVLVGALGLSSQQEAALIDAGYEFAHQLRDATDDELLAVEGIGKRTVEFIRGRTG